MRNKVRFVARHLLVPALACCVLLCCRQRAEPEPVRIGFLGTLTGEVERDGQLNLAGARLAVDELNRGGGLEIDGRRHVVELIVADTANTPEAAVRGARQLINRDDVVALVGPFVSSTAIPVAELAERSGVLMISPSASHPEVTRDKHWVFRVCFDDDFQGGLMARFAYGDLGARKAAVLYDLTNTYSSDIAEVFQRQFEASGGEVVGAEGFVRDELDFTGPLQRFADAGAEVLFLPNFSDRVRLQAQQARRLGLAATFLGSDIWNETLLGEVPELDGAFKADHWHPDVAGAEAEDFLAAFGRIHGEVPDVSRAALAYDAVGLLARTIRDGNSLDGTAMRAVLADLEGYSGVTGAISYRGGGDPKRSAVILQFHGGEAVLHRQVAP